ncbi:heterokaryon incompatibility protein-domain-containing protein [Xylariaceae sp. FL0016]|nr:heterokaryon incompatibility protein-domain-containing protein [Xylariaceae sp. FL0016]
MKPQPDTPSSRLAQLHKLDKPREAVRSLALKLRQRAHHNRPPWPFNSGCDDICSNCRSAARLYATILSTAYRSQGVIGVDKVEAPIIPCSLCELFAAVWLDKYPGTDTVTAGSSARYVLVPRATEGDWHPTGIYSVWAVNILGREARLAALRDHAVVCSLGLTIHEHSNRRLNKQARNMDRRHHGEGRGMVMLATDKRKRDKANRLGAQLVNRERLDFDAARRWIRECEQHHPLCSARQGGCFPSQVIDCHTGRVVQTSALTEYVALSYVWGSQSAPLPSSSFSVGDTPRVIQDAVSVTMSLGYRYLWVDKYCIDQSNPESKMQQISVMDQIYENAAITLVDAMGENDAHGLAGSARVDGLCFALVARDAGFALQGCKWATRGWTYQEAVLSRRCLLFTKTQVFFVCRTTSLCEAMPRMPRIVAPSGSEVTLNSLFEDKKSKSQFKTFADSNSTDTGSLIGKINVYQFRDLRYGSDGFNAFRGVLNRSPLHSYWGIPFITGSKLGILDTAIDTENGLVFTTHRELGITDAFLRGMCWIPQDAEAKRRERMPTWSWVSLAGCKIDFPQDPDRVVESFSWRLRTWSTTTEVSIAHQASLSSATIPVGKLQLNGKVAKELGRFLKVTSMVYDVHKFRTWNLQCSRGVNEVRERVFSIFVGEDMNSMEPVQVGCTIDCPREFAREFG